jgi:hypothetical protein
VNGRHSRAVLAITGLVVGALIAALLVALVLGDEPLVSKRGTVDVSYPAGEVKQARVLGAVDLYYDGEPKPGASVLGAIALFVLATASLVTFFSLRFAGARRKLRLFWLIAAAGLAVAATDELFAVHESVGHNLQWLADIPGVKRPDDFLMSFYLVGALAFAWWFRDVLREYRPTFVCMIAAIAFFAGSAGADLASAHVEEWFELFAGLFVAAGLVLLMHRHLKRNLQIKVRVGPLPRSEQRPVPAKEPAEPVTHA